MATPTITPSRFADGQPMQLAGLQSSYGFSEMDKLPAQWGRLGPYIDTIPGQVAPTGYGLVTDSNDGQGFDYFTGMEFSDVSQLPAEFVVRQIPAQRYAVFTYSGHVSEIDKTVDKIFKEWAPTSGHTLTNTPSLMEKYGEEFDPETSSGIVEFWVAINEGK